MVATLGLKSSPVPSGAVEGRTLSKFSLLTNHARLLLAIANEPGLRGRDMADRLHLSERGVALILRDLRNSGYISGQRDGRSSMTVGCHGSD